MSDNKLGLRLVYHGLVRAKKNSKHPIRNSRTGRLGIVTSKEARDNEDDMVKQFKVQSPRFDVPSPVSISIDIFEPDYYRRDLDNQASTILDALVRSHRIEDDGIKNVVDLHVCFAGVDRKDPRAVIHIQHVGVSHA